MVASRAVAALREEFGVDAGIFAEPGYQGRVRIKVVSPNLSGIPHEEQQEVIWRRLRAALGDDAQGISVVIAYGTDEL